VRVVKRGSLLIEFLLYIALCNILFIALFQLVSKFHGYHYKLGLSLYENSAYWRALDLFIAELEAAPADINQWHFFDPQGGCVWLKNGVSVGWLYKDMALYRQEGPFNADLQQWGRKSVSLVAHNIERFTLERHDADGSVRFYRLKLKSKHSLPVEVFIKPMNGHYA